ncbi:DUF2927 domain-containing protein [Limibaculum sp. M0105]|uniref:DUF2927 domain-containing protein n=1 Tax=Thermohalobaculum xanthum TaxID=2753746 RepID=A0A8J7M961_9RHOB|nr:DUF2927 domain-containing protein [Thermohalobaculum xanthum]MBK0400626.1 DUF2927 domain-containing protein [Thermohalobaculum xanthum]
MTACPTRSTGRSLHRQARAATALALTGVLAGALAACAPYQDGSAWAGYALQREESGGLRLDRSPPDAPFDSRDVTRNFLTVALGAEPNPVGTQHGERSLPSGVLRRWEAPIRWLVADDSTTSVRDGPRVERTFERLARLTGHDIAPAGDGPANLYVLFLRPEDYPALTAAPSKWPSGQWLMGFVDRFGRAPGTPCVATFTATGDGAAEGPDRIAFAVVLIRAGLPSRLAEACVEEELSQTMGLPNDDPHIRPSIFNDDQEFALLTRHDEILLRMLYDPRLEPGMTTAQIAPIAGRLATDVMQQTSVAGTVE